jgi:beta-glucanase (GH16 family)
LLGLAGLIAVLAVGAFYAVRARPARAGLEPLGIPGNWRLVLDSEFNGKHLPAGWKAGWLAGGVTPPTNVLEDDCYSPRNVTFPGDGTVHLSVTAVSSVCRGVWRPFTGALINTDPDDGRGSGFQYTYGVLQARVYLPEHRSGVADWPAVWADGQDWPQDGEDDVIEGLYGQACYHFHYLSRSGQQTGPGNCAPRFRSGWHTVASDWQKGSVTYYYDGRRVGSIRSGITSEPMFLILDYTATTDSPTPDSMRVSYVRVWQK